MQQGNMLEIPKDHVGIMNSHGLEISARMAVEIEAILVPSLKNPAGIPYGVSSGEKSGQRERSR